MAVESASLVVYKFPCRWQRGLAMSRWTDATDCWPSGFLAPRYIGGWSAAEHWGLTEQNFPLNPGDDDQETAQPKACDQRNLLCCPNDFA